MFSNTDVLVATAVLQWANEHLCTPTDRMRRSRGGLAETVCPFVGDSEEWFSACSLRFGARFRDTRTLKTFEQPLLEEYSRACARFVK